MITYSIFAHQVTALLFSQTGTDLLPRRNGDLDKPSATINPYKIMVLTRTWTRAVGLKSEVVVITQLRHTVIVTSDCVAMNVP